VTGWGVVKSETGLRERAAPLKVLGDALPAAEAVRDTGERLGILLALENPTDTLSQLCASAP